MKNVIILGANGHTSQEIIPRLLEQDNLALTLFLRHADRLKGLNSDRVQVIEGDAREPDALRQALLGQDIVISTMGGMDLGDKMETVVTVMEELGVPRLIAISAGGIYDELPEPFNAWDKSMTGYTRPTNLKAAQVIERSSLKYTILRPVWLTNKPIEEFELTRKGETFKGTETSRASIGRFVAKVVTDPALYVNENLGISQPRTDGDRPAAYR
ncbi:SDR family oxidoreductase [Frateuria aurantia]|uniref:NmrA-like family protein n=1 Tax=Frateuria aurantia (strain ATCC 33424 / DSM 6220 / KCTC 2777 / LMG 1558 / NBRC 3245 / NCIMB 13370) TaxID=767434 RepID=H8L4K3_FRAAD|nr:SDR family oxidoreductase [Frateuria aurantia]AFC85679.1 NmrA-like family protein [Frateuria aurantia DSM 6220]